MRHRWSAWLTIAVGVTVLGLVIESARDTGTQARNSAASRPASDVIMARTAAAISAAGAGRVLQVIATTSQGVSRVIIDDPGEVTELVRNRGGGTMSESAIRKLPGPARSFESRTVDFVAGRWSQTVLAGAPGDPSGAVIETPAEAITAQLHHQIGLASRAPAHAGQTHARVVRATSVDGVRTYVVVLTGPGGPPVTVWISRSSWLPVQSASREATASYEWTAPDTVSPASLWPGVPAGLARIPPE
jgi:hypothetical protein